MMKRNLFSWQLANLGGIRKAQKSGGFQDGSSCNRRDSTAGTGPLINQLSQSKQKILKVYGLFYSGFR